MSALITEELSATLLRVERDGAVGVLTLRDVERGLQRLASDESCATTTVVRGVRVDESDLMELRARMARGAA